MTKKAIFTILSIFIIFATNTSCATKKTFNKKIKVGAENIELYIDSLKGKRVAIMANQTSFVENKHIVDFLLEKGINIVGIFAAEHGFRGDYDAGENVTNSIYKKTGIPIWSVYNTKDKLSKEYLDNINKIDVLLFDIQDVGLRFYTYYISMAKLMDICAEFKKKMIILDRPNPNGSYVDGPILDMKYKSGIGWLPIPIVHGITLGELALMINGEGWLPNKIKCDVKVIPCKNYNRNEEYILPINPSPNLKTQHSIYLYPSTCLFEGTIMSLGRGTNYPFEVYGHPNYKNSEFKFTPKSISGAKNPPLVDQICYGKDLRNITNKKIINKGFDLSYIIDAYNNLNISEKFFNNLFNLLVGVDYIKKDIIEGKTASEISLKWKSDVEKFKKQRKPYLLY